MKTHSKPYLPATLLAAAVIASTASCSVFGAGDETRRIGVISYYSEPVLIDAPTTARTGEHFDVRVRTYGGGCIRQGETSTTVEGLRAGVTPYDIDSGASACTDELRTFEHTARLRFDGAGLAIITVRGRRLPEDEIVIIEHQLIVQ